MPCFKQARRYSIFRKLANFLLCEEVYNINNKGISIEQSMYVWKHNAHLLIDKLYNRLLKISIKMIKISVFNTDIDYWSFSTFLLQTLIFVWKLPERPIKLKAC